MNKRNENPIVKGDLAEKMFELECIKRNIPIYKPVNSATREDFVVVMDGVFKRVQIKFISASNNSSVIAFSMSKPQNGRRDSETGKPLYKIYNENEVDLFFIYCPDTNQWYKVPISTVKSRQRSTLLRLTAPLNNQSKGVTYASDYIW